MGYDIDLDSLGNYYLDSYCFDIGLGMDFVCLTSTTRILTSEKSTCILASVGSTSSRLTSIILIVVVIISIIIIALVFLYLYWRGFQFLLRLFAGFLLFCTHKNPGFFQYFIQNSRCGLHIQLGKCLHFIHSVPHNSNSLISNYRLFRRLPSTPKITPLTQC